MFNRLNDETKESPGLSAKNSSRAVTSLRMNGVLFLFYLVFIENEGGFVFL